MYCVIRLTQATDKYYEETWLRELSLNRVNIMMHEKTWTAAALMSESYHEI